MRRTWLALAAVAALVPGVFTGCGGERDEPADAAPAARSQTVDVAQEAQRIEVGMTEADVRRILGEPRTRVTEAAGDRLTFWTFDDEEQVRSRVVVQLDKNGKVVEVGTIPL